MESKLIYPEQIIYRDAPVNYDPNLHGVKNFVDTSVKLPSLYSHVANKVTVTPYGAMFKNGYYFNPQPNIEWHLKNKNKLLSYYKKILTNKKIYIESPSIYITNAAYDNYFHWLIECLPKLIIFKKELKNLTLIIPEKLSKFHYSFLNYFQFKNIVFLKDNQIAETKELYFTDPINPNGNFYPELTENFSNQIIEQIETKEIKYDIPHFFISRNKSKSRKLINEAQIISELLGNKLEVLNMEDFNTEEQIGLFQQAQNIAGVHGAAMSNIIFCQHTNQLIDFIHYKDFSNCFYNLSTIKKIKYEMRLCQSFPKEINPSRDNLIYKF